MVQNEPLTIILWLWNGWRPIYDYRHVNAVAGMVFDHLTLPHRVVCITDKPDNIICETYPIWDMDVKVRGLPTNPKNGAVYPNSYRRLKMFSPWAAQEFPGQVLSLDIDCVICGDMTPLITEDDFKINLGRASPYNGGMWLLRTGTRTQVWDTFHQDAFKITTRKRYTGSDQAWISHILKNEKTYDAADGIYHYSLNRAGKKPDDCRIMFCAGGTKPWSPDFQRRFPDLAKTYQRYFR